MNILIILLCLFSIYLLIITFKNTNWYNSFLYTSLFVGGFVYLSSEVLSLFDLFNFKYIRLSWLLLFAITFWNLFKRKELIMINIPPKLNTFFHSKNKVLLTSFIALIGILSIQGIIYPPNNWDSLTYHMGRIPHWIMLQSLDPFPTHIYRQIYSPPLSELIIAHICILTKADIFANLIQTFYLISCLSAVLSILHLLKITRIAKIIICILVITTPEFILQASTTQNDLIVSFFILSSCYFILKSYLNEKQELLNIFSLSLSVGLALYTKGTAYIYLFPILIMWGFSILFKFKNLKSILYLCILPLTITLVNGPFYYRNYNLSGDFLGKNEDKLFNEEFSIKSFILTAAKNTGNHMGVPIISDITNKSIEKLHLILKEDIANPSTNFNGIRFKLSNWQHHEDNASNIIQILLIIIVFNFFILNFRQQSTTSKVIALILILELFLFSFLLKWQPWHTRLICPIFFLSYIWIAVVFSKINLSKRQHHLLNFITSTSICYALTIIILNPIRPLISNASTSNVQINDSRLKKYCANNLSLEQDYKWVKKLIEKHASHTALEMGGDMWEYLLYYDIYSKELKMPYLLNIDNLTNRLNQNKQQKIKFVVSFKNKKSYLLDHRLYRQIREMKQFTIYEHKSN
jgi:hypothetical protein